MGDLGRDCMGIVGRDGEDEGDWQGGMCALFVLVFRGWVGSPVCEG